MKRAFRLTMLLAATCATTVSAQVVTAPESLAKATVTCTGCEAPAVVLSRHLLRGDMAKLQGYASELLHTLSRTGPGELRKALGDVRRNYYRLVWVARDESGGTAVQSAVVHDGATEAVRVLPGITPSSSVQLLDVFVSADAGAMLDSQYVSTAVKDPLMAQIPAFVEKTGVIGFLAGLPLARGDDTTVSTTYSVARATLPLERADVKIKDTVVVPGSSGGLRRASADLRDRLLIREARLSACAQGLARADADAIAAGLGRPSCTAAPGQTGLAPGGVNACRAELLDLLDAEYRKAAACHDAAPPPGVDPLPVVDKQFSDLVGTLRETRRTAEWKLSNAPRTRYTFGVLSAAIIGSPNYSGDTIRAKVGANGTLIQDPLPTFLTMAVVNIHPVPYDAQQDRPSASERVRVFAGTTITPDFGIGGGVGVMIVRGLTINAGWVNLFVKTPRQGLKLGQTPPAGQTPLTVGNAGIWFAGLGYNFK